MKKNHITQLTTIFFLFGSIFVFTAFKSTTPFFQEKTALEAQIEIPATSTKS